MPPVTWVSLLVALILVVLAARSALRFVSVLSALSWTPRLLRVLSGMVGARYLTEDELFAADGAPERWQEQRRQAFERLSARLREQHGASAEWGTTLRDGFSDLRFTDLSRVPFPFVEVMRRKFSLFSVVTASKGARVQNLDGQWTLDVSGSYGLNVAGYDQYKEWIGRGWDRVKDVGPVLGPVHPLVAGNVAALKQISGLDEVSFHMSGTEAVMAAVRLARFNTRRSTVVCFAGAYHGWWDGVQAGLGSERDIGDCMTLKDMSPASLRAIGRRARTIAAVLVNPVQSLHPNLPPPNDAVLLTSQVRRTSQAEDRYREWLAALRETCTRHGIPLIFDEVYTGFRLAPGGAQEYFGVRADMVVYGKTVGGGMPIGVVCGRSRLMRRVDREHPMRMAYIVGTFSAHPTVMGAMAEFLAWVERPERASEYERANLRCAEWVDRTNARLEHAALPVRLANFSTIWTVLFTEPSRFSWLFQYYLRAEGVTLSWVGTGRCLSTLDFSDEDYDALTDAIVTAATRMKQDGWWLTTEQFPERDQRMRTNLVRETLASVTPKPIREFYTAVKQRKEDDHHASHNNVMNQYLHLVSSSVFIYCYAILATDLTQAMFLGLAALFVRQFGHAVLEPACHDEEETLLGFNTPNKTLIVLVYSVIPVVLMAQAGTWSFQGFVALADLIALQWFRWTLVVVLGRVAYLTWKHDFNIAMVWFVKLVTDPFTDIVAYFPRRTQRA